MSEMSLFELSNMITPHEDGEPSTHLRTGIVVTATTPITVNLGGATVPAVALESAVLAVSKVVLVLTRTGAPPVILGGVVT